MPTHEERRVLPYTPRQLFDLVADIERYPEFLPWCAAARVKGGNGNTLLADLVIGFGMLREHFTSRVVLEPDAPTPRLDMSLVEGPFKFMNGHWQFRPIEQGCEVGFSVDFEFRSRLLQTTIQLLFHEAVRQMVRAFEERARKIYGK